MKATTSSSRKGSGIAASAKTHEAGGTGSQEVNGLSEYHRLATRLEINGVFPLLNNGQPRFDLRDGQPVVPLDLVLETLEVLAEVFYEKAGDSFQVVWSWRTGGDYASRRPGLVEAVLAAANAALDAREGKK